MTDKVIMTNRLDSVQLFKEKVMQKFMIPVESQKLVLRTFELTYGDVLTLCATEQGQILLHVCDTRSCQLYISTPDGRHSLLDYVPSLPVHTLKQRIQTIEGLAKLPVNQMRLTFAGRELNDDTRSLQGYGVENESTVHLTLRIVGGSEPDEDHGSHEDYNGSDTDVTASATSLPTDSDGELLFNHRDVRVLDRFAAYTAPSPVDDPVPSSQATTLRYVASPDGEGEADGLYRSERVGLDADPEPEDEAPASNRRRLNRHRACSYQVFARCESKWLLVWVCASDTIAEVKTQIIDAMQWPGASPLDIRLVSGVRDLDNERSLSDYNIREHANLWVLPRIRGGTDDDEALDFQMWLFPHI